MKIEIWSDVACPWCYIGKKRFEKALSQFPHADKIEVEWKSFLLNPSQTTEPETSLATYLANHKGMPEEQVQQMMQTTANTGKREDIDFNFDGVIPANTVRAHALLQLAKDRGLGAQLKQHLFHAYFTDNKNLDDPKELFRLGGMVGLSEEEIREALTSDAPFRKVERDLKEANALGIQGVPFFVIDRKYGISGAQEAPALLQALEKAYGEFKNKQGQDLEISEGDSCDTEGNC
ncbi:DsbA family oxidoreductase [Robertkochia sediminum]|uniref:DsbA family oxidoreductase n=1 Tax=Robertkochia sediminum TaxID=2785326 RepID=UPI001933AC62|nr:DsbA family oxidoreductase [Robertkochia sediminum]MBL7473959.1 DsbA family oxidoreductase [Robertkochia sediminum]